MASTGEGNGDLLTIVLPAIGSGDLLILRAFVLALAFAAGGIASLAFALSLAISRYVVHRARTDESGAAGAAGAPSAPTDTAADTAAHGDTISVLIDRAVEETLEGNSVRV